MSTLPRAHSGGGVTLEPAAGPRGASRATVALAGALLAVVLYAAFAHGAASNSTDTRIQVAIAVIAVLAGAVGLWTGTLRLGASPLAIAGVGLLATFALWSGVTVLWSVAPDQTWIELNRALSYAIVLCLAIALGASEPRSLRWVAIGFFVVSLVVALYAIGQKLLPGVDVLGVNLNQSGPLPRLQEPFGYWNALALFVAMGVPIALSLAADWTRLRRDRLGALIALVVMLLVIGFTYSRGGMIALIVCLIVGIGVSGARLRSLMWLAAACLALIPPLAFGLATHALTTANVSLGARESAGLELTAILVASLLVLALGARKLFELEATIHVAPEQGRRIGRLLGWGLATLVVLGVVAVALSSRGLTGTISHEWHNFTTTRATSNYQPDRLLSVDSENRWVWWKEAAGAFSARPVLGWGAGSFPVVHLLYRRDTLSVNQPHSVPLQFLAETGAIGAILAIGGFALLLAAGWRAVRRHPIGGERLLAAALLAGAVAYAVHALYDWDWDIPGVTLPALLFLGVLAGSSRAAGVRSRPAISALSTGIRAAAVAVLALCLCTFALSVILPSLAASKASAADVAASSNSAATVSQALSEAKLAASLDPLSDAGLRVEATIAVRRGQLPNAQAALLEAIKRDPTDGQAWLALFFVESGLRDQQAAMQAAVRYLELDPHAAGAPKLASDIGQLRNLLITPPRESPTARPVMAR